MKEPTYNLFEAAPLPVAPFSHAVECGDWVFITGQMPTDPDDNDAPIPGTWSLRLTA